MTAETPSKKVSRKSYWSLLAGVLGIGFGVWMGFGLVPILIAVVTGVKVDPQNLGQIGDQFGAANALFSGLAMIAAICAVWQGQRMLDIQQQELRETREELKKSADAQKRLVDSQVMLSIMADLRSEEMQKAVPLLLRALTDLGEHMPDFLARVGGIRRGEHSLVHDAEFRGNVNRASVVVNAFFDRIYRLHQYKIIDDDVIRLAIGESAMMAFVNVGHKVATATSNHIFDGASELIGRLLDNPR